MLKSFGSSSAILSIAASSFSTGSPKLSSLQTSIGASSFRCCCCSWAMFIIGDEQVDRVTSSGLVTSASVGAFGEAGHERLTTIAGWPYSPEDEELVEDVDDARLASPGVLLATGLVVLIPVEGVPPSAATGCCGGP
uniref:Putative secreted protein n=1 Tax=Anopheles darlingi TaxID=43151 RepID=A0A2M4D489_ANODA